MCGALQVICEGWKYGRCNLDLDKLLSPVRGRYSRGSMSEDTALSELKP